MNDRVKTASSCVLCAVLLLVLGSCESVGQMGKSLSNPLQALAGDWTVQEIGGVDVASMLPQGMRFPSLTIGTDGSVNGFGGVNQLTSSLNIPALAEGNFALSPVASTRMAGPPAAMDVESKLIQALGETSWFKLEGDTLSLNGPESTMARLARGDA